MLLPFRESSKYPLNHTCCSCSLFLFHFLTCHSIKTRSRVIQVWWCSGSCCCAASWKVLHPPSRSNWNLLVSMAIHPRPKIQAVGLGSSTGKYTDFSFCRSSLGRAAAYATYFHPGYLILRTVHFHFSGEESILSLSLEQDKQALDSCLLSFE